MNTPEQWLIFSADEYAFACEMKDVVEIIQIKALKPAKEAPPQVIGWVDLADQTLPVINLVEHIHHNSASYPCYEIIVIEKAGKRVGLAAEHILAISKPGAEEDLEHCISLDKFCLMEKMTYLDEKAVQMPLQ